MPHPARDVKAALLKKGFHETAKKKRDHDYYFFMYNGKKTNVYTKISHGEREIHDGNCSLMARQIKLSNPQFNDFVGCLLRSDQYLQHLVQGNHV